MLLIVLKVPEETRKKSTPFRVKAVNCVAIALTFLSICQKVSKSAGPFVVVGSPVAKTAGFRGPTPNCSDLEHLHHHAWAFSHGPNRSVPADHQLPPNSQSHTDDYPRKTPSSTVRHVTLTLPPSDPPLIQPLGSRVTPP